MTKTKGASVPEVVDDYNRRVNFDFGRGGLKEPKGFSDLTVGQEVTVLVTGKVNSIRLDQDSSNFGLIMDSIKLQIKKDEGLAGDFQEAKAGRKL